MCGNVGGLGRWRKGETVRGTWARRGEPVGVRLFSYEFVGISTYVRRAFWWWLADGG